ncbi:MAG TPA: cupredoxin domain-containing protein [Nitrospiria bacterium]|nr:cupredoxin domain-containing protein [Nitrospiria bacterium]
MTRWWWAAGALAVAVAAFLPSALSHGQEARIVDVVIAKDSYAFDPPRVAIEVGDTVRWRNEDVRRHLTSSIPGFGPDTNLEIFCEDLYAGKSCVHTFTKPGRYPYFCFVHNRMQGEVVVVDR